MFQKLLPSLVVLALLGTPALAGFTTQLGFTPYFANESIYTGGELVYLDNFSEVNAGAPSYLFQGIAAASGEFKGAPVLHGFAQLAASYVPYNALSQHRFTPMRVESQVTYNDRLTVFSPTAHGPVTIRMTYAITGFFANPTGISSDGLLTTGGAVAVQNLPQYSFGGPIFTSSFRVPNGGTFDYSLTMFTSVVGPAAIPADFANPIFFHAQGIADYSNTMRLTGLSFADEDGTSIGAELRSSTGELFAVQGSSAPVPEPATWLQALLGLVSIGIWRRRQVARRVGRASRQ